jgi:hypothetical protein
MKKESTYRYPSKLKKFGIDDPFLNVLVAKYENQIPWQTRVKDSDSLNSFIKEQLLPTFLKRIAFPINKTEKHYYISSRSVNLELALTTDLELNQANIKLVRECKIKNGDAAAVELLANLINQNKKKAYYQWKSLMAKEYDNSPAFQFMVLRSIFESTGKGSRRSLPPPDQEVLKWLYQRIQKQRLTPIYNVSKEYFLKSAFGINITTKTGWLYVPKGLENAGQLTALCKSSGWCVASFIYAEEYLHLSDFYILHSDSQPVVALRTHSNTNEIIECQGRNNASPKSWFHDIHFFIKSKNLILKDRFAEYNEAIKTLDLEDQSIDWWEARVEHWPLAIKQAPTEVKNKLNKLVLARLWSCIQLLPLADVLHQLNLDFKQDDYVQLLKIAPDVIKQIPKGIMEKNENQFMEACKTGWIEKIEDQQLTYLEIKGIPEFVRESEVFNKTFASNFPENLDKLLVRRPKNREGRTSRILLETVLPATETEADSVAVKRVCNILLNNVTSDFTDSIFPVPLLKHPSFKLVRENGWAEAIKINPTLRLALPDNLKAINRFHFDVSNVKHTLLLKWTTKVEERPWLLTQKNTVPKSVRYREEILMAYVKGWSVFLEQAPYRMWVVSGGRYTHGSRVYMSYAALRNTTILNAMISGYISGFEKEINYWKGYNSAISNGMKKIPAIQLAMLLASYKYPNFKMIKEEIIDITINVKAKSKDPMIAYIQKMIKADTEKVINKFQSSAGPKAFQLSELNENKEFNRKVSFGDKVKVLFNGEELLFSFCKNINGYSLISRKSPEYNAIVGLRRGEKFKIGPLEGEVTEFIN